MTVDVEDYFHVAALSSVISRQDWDSLAPRVETSTRVLLDLFDENKVSATFFVLGWVGRKFPQLVREIVLRGHEVACHGMSHQLIYTQRREEFRSETRDSKRLLEDTIGQAVNGYRAASYSITESSRWALDELVDAGFLYDSSIFPVRHDLYGIKDAPRFIHELETPSGSRLVEFPPTTARHLGLNWPASGGGYFRIYPYMLSKWLLRSVNSEGEPFVFYLHPWEVDFEQPRVSVGLKSRFRHYHNLHKCLPRLRRLIKDFRFGTMDSVLSQSTRLSSSPLTFVT